METKASQLAIPARSNLAPTWGCGICSSEDWNCPGLIRVVAQNRREKIAVYSVWTSLVPLEWVW